MGFYLLIFLLALSPRVIYLLIQGWTLAAVSGYRFYWDLSESLLRYGTLGFEGQRSTANEPLYPLFLAASRWLAKDNLFFVMTLQAVVASVGAIYFYKLCLLLSERKRVARVGVLLYSFYPYLVRQTGAVIEVSVLAVLLIVCAYFYCRAADVKGFAAAGLAFGLTLLMRVAVLPVFLLSVCFLFLKKRFLNALIFTGSALLLMVPLFLRNYRIDGSLLLTRNGLNLFKANCEYTDKIIPSYSIDLLTPYAFEVLHRERPEVLALGERAVDQFFTEKAVAFMRANPLRVLKLRLMSAAYLFYPHIVPFYPMHAKARLVFTDDGGIRVENSPMRPKFHDGIHSMAYGFVFLTALCGLYLRRSELLGQDAVLLFIASGFVAVYSLYFPATRLMAPMDFVLMFYSACALSSWGEKFRKLGKSGLSKPHPVLKESEKRN